MNQLDNTGLQINTTAEILANLTSALQLIYGSDINLASNSPDGQILGIFTQAIIDMLELLVSIYNSFDPDTAVGSALDARCALNGITRIPGTFTIQNIAVTVDRNVTLAGLDALANDIDGTGFTVMDEAGTEFILIATVALTAGTTTVAFRAAEIGMVEVLQNTITNIKTVTLGVTTVNNPAVSTSIGVNEETDGQLRLRRANSLMLGANGASLAVQSALRAAALVTDALVIENATGSAIGSQPAHSIWPIVDGSIADADIAQIIYVKRSAGCAMYGGSTYAIVGDRTSITIAFDRVVSENMYIQFTLNPRVAGTVFDNTYIKAQLALLLTYKIGQHANTNDIISLMNTIEPAGFLTVVGVSKTAGSYTETLTPTALKNKFAVATTRIDIVSP